MPKETTATGRAKGGIARSESLTPERRKEIAAKGARARWRSDGDELPIAEYAGELKFGELSFPCAVLPDGTRVLSESDFMSGLGMYRSGALSVRRDPSEAGGAQIPLYLAFKNLLPYVIRHLDDVHITPLRYRSASGGTAHGIPAAIIPRICSIWLDARKDGVLGPRQTKIADMAELLLRSIAEVGIVALVDEATGYQAARPRDALQQYLEMIVRKDLAVWAKKFPDEFYENIYKLRGWPWTGMKKNRYSAVAGYTRDLVYDRMAPGLLKELEEKSPKDEKGQRENKLHQWLSSDIGDPMLANHLQSILTLQRLSLANGWGWSKFMKMVDQVMQRKGQTLELPFGFDAE
ncbi:P63C domain-containing protein [Pseudomonas sp. MDT2-39-1]